LRYPDVVIGSRKTLFGIGMALVLALGAVPALASDAEAPVAAAAKKKKKKKKKKVKRIKVRKIRPRTGRTFVKLDAAVRIRFSQPVDPESVSDSTVEFRRLLGEDVAYDVAFEKNNKQLVLTPRGFLDPGKDYEVTVRFGLASSSGGQLKREARSIFFTDSTVPPFQFLRPEQFVPIASQMAEGRAAHTATRLENGDVLIAGGYADGTRVSDTAELFDRELLEFRAITSSRLQHPRAYHVATRVSTGAMLVGGWTGNGAADTTEIFDPLVRELRPGPRMVEERDFHAAVTLNDGRVLVVGGLRYVGAGAEFSLTAEIFDPSIGAFRETRSRPMHRRAGLALTLLDDGTVLITGGLPQGAAPVAVAEIFDPARESFRATATPSLGFRQLHTATKLSSGAVLLADGGNPKMEIYDPLTDRFFEAGGASFARRTRATASALAGDRVLILGGFDQRGDETLILESMDLYIPTLGGGLGRVVRPDVVLPEARAGHTATNLDEGRVLFTGGFGPEGPDNLSSAFMFVSD
jgi:hypothetical protein